VCLLIWPYYATVNRIRIWGRLPAHRGSTLIICNHQHDNDNTPMVAAMQLAGASSRPIYCAAGRRMFEPGFMGMRLPLLRPLLRRFDPTKLFLALGLVPIENEIRTRAMASLAWWVYTRHGDLTVAEVFDDTVVGAFDAQAAQIRLKALFSGRWFERANTMRVPIKNLREPYRGEVLAETRARLEPDYRRFEQLLAQGNTLYLTPEGHYSSDGRLGRLQTALTRFISYAQQIFVISISYDVFVGRRLSGLFRILPPIDPDDLATSICAPRAVTVSQLLGAWLFERGQTPFTRADAEQAVRARLASLPATAFVDPELRRDPSRMTRAALDGLRRLGAIEMQSDTLTLARACRHPQFPLVNDMVAFQARFFDETVAALERLAGRTS
jgi:1-acyl-sn-glycerol-3-phosphate acyltransferase